MNIMKVRCANLIGSCSAPGKELDILKKNSSLKAGPYSGEPVHIDLGLSLLYGNVISLSGWGIRIRMLPEGMLFWRQDIGF